MEKEEQKSKPEEESQTENFTVSEPKVIFDGNCDHYYEFIGIDPEGKNEAMCKKCPMGRYYLNDMEIKDGKIVNK